MWCVVVCCIFVSISCVVVLCCVWCLSGLFYVCVFRYVSVGLRYVMLSVMDGVMCRFALLWFALMCVAIVCVAACSCVL